MGEKTKHLGAGVREDSELWEEFNNYRDPGESKSATIRQLLRAGLEREGYIDRPASDSDDQPATAVGLIAAELREQSSALVVAGAMLLPFAVTFNAVAFTVTAAAFIVAAAAGSYLRYRSLDIENGDSDAPTADPRAGGG